MRGVLLDRTSGRPVGLRRLPADAYGRLLGDPAGERILDLLELARGSEILGYDPHTNFAYSTVQAGSTIIGQSDSPRTIALGVGDGNDFPTGGEFNVVVWPPGSRPLSSNAEIVRVTRSADVLTSTARGQEGTAAISTIAVGYQVMAAVTVKTIEDVEASDEVALVTFIANVTIVSVTETAPTDVVSSGAIPFSGQPVLIEFYSPLVKSVANQTLFLNIWEDSTDLGRIGAQGKVGFEGGDGPVFAPVRLTPAAGTHTYKVRGWSSSGATGTVQAGAGGAGILRPGYIRILEEGGP